MENDIRFPKVQNNYAFHFEIRFPYKTNPAFVFDKAKTKLAIIGLTELIEKGIPELQSISTEHLLKRIGLEYQSLF